VTGKQYALTVRAPPRLTERQRPDPGNLAIYNGAELINDGQCRSLGNQPGKPRAELFAVAQNVKRSQPRGNITEADRRGRGNKGTVNDSGFSAAAISARRDAINDRFIRCPPSADIGDTARQRPAD